jgi:hypothetical protein
MSIAVVKSLTVIAVGAAGAAYAVNKVYQPSKTQGIAGAMRLQLDQQNADVHPAWDQRYARYEINSQKVDTDGLL